MHSFLAPLLFITFAFTAANFDVKTRNNTKKKNNEEKVVNRGGFRLPFKPGGHLIPGIRVTNDSDAIVIENIPNRGGVVFPPAIRPIRPPAKCPKPNTCLGRCANERQFENITGERDYPVCFCDPECNSVFRDCCADYEKHCRNASQLREGSHEWTCFMVPGFSFGVWLIGSCKPEWSDKEVHAKCTTTALKELDKASILIPVIDENNNTFRNRYCAQCNGVEKFASWMFKGMICNSKLTNSTPHEKAMGSVWDDDCNVEKINFVSQTRAIRYCYDVQDECKYDDNPEVVRKCKTATTGLVNIGNRTYRNLDCLRCNLNTRTWSLFALLALKISCGPPINSSEELKRFVSFGKLFQLHYGTPQSPIRCPPGFLYDIVVPGHCRKLVTTLGRSNLPNKLFKRYAVRMKYEPVKSSSCLPDTKTNYAETARKIQRQFGAAFKRKIKLGANNRNWQISDLEIQAWDDASSLVTFQILLELSTDNGTAPRFRLQFSEIKYIYFHLNPTGVICKYYLSQNVAQEMRCKENRTYEVDKPESAIPKNGTVFVNETKEHYSVGQYLVYRYENKTWLAVCKDYRPANCSYYLDIENRTLWDMFPNRSIYSNVTESVFDYGEYSIIDGTLWLCLTKDHLADTKPQIPRDQNSVHNHILSYVTLVSLTISIVSLLVLLTMYSVFPSLRNLPGKNLMLLCGVLSLGQLLWLLQDEVYSLSSTACVVTSVVLQYLFLSTFCCSSSIAFHSFTTFHGIAKGKLRPQGGAFLWYAMHSLGSPLVLVAVCWLLDFFKVISIGYGGGQGHCWLAGQHGMYLAFFTPLFILLAFNFALFIATARVIHNCTKASRDLAEKNGAPNKKQVGVYLRMATVIGLTWLFGLFQLIFPKVVVFEYLFVIVNGFQGFYIAVAFLFTYNVKKMVFKHLSKVTTTSSTKTTAKIKS